MVPNKTKLSSSTITICFGCTYRLSGPINKFHFQLVCCNFSATNRLFARTKRGSIHFFSICTTSKVCRLKYKQKSFRSLLPVILKNFIVFGFRDSFLYALLMSNTAKHMKKICCNYFRVPLLEDSGLYSLYKYKQSSLNIQDPTSL